MKNNLPVGTIVDYKCPILGDVRGPIREVRRSVENGREHAVIGLHEYPQVEIIAPFSEVAEVPRV